ncbi:M20/M25/M40 family metallo-hydrolase [Thermomicrobium sp. CFH 73360]|uniref:M20/M25/M40 family metallo-hydrolase n=1 Tax=Thermomicrobium sp. CFH 73360 TaxID=2951987 RepID=UPI00207680F9|nr:M20/M25/M40 family metallo-hydrolase [Thermomicrobium sp. CFH 73360]
MTEWAIDWASVRDEVTRHLQALIRFETVNPPGNETALAEYLATVLEREGIPAEVIESAPGRGNLVARIRGSGRARPLLLMAHSDVVSVEREKWTRDPFGGELVNGRVWGRGAVDTKGLVACELGVMLLLRRLGLPLERDLIFAVFADEEAGSQFGACWMWQHRRELIDAEYAINEGGGMALELGGRRFYLCQTGEKGAARLRLTARGEPGHASMPIPNTAMQHAARAILTLSTHTFPTVLTPTVIRLLRELGEALGKPVREQITAVLADPTWERLATLPLGPAERRLLYAMTRNTAVPTIVHGGHRINVIPSEVVVEVDGRILPGQDPEAFAAEVQRLVGPNVEVELTSRGRGLEAEPDSPLFRTICETMAELDPGARVVPYLVPGGTDAKCLPGIKVYGFMPMRDHPEEFDLAHAHDERISVSTLEFATRALFEIVMRFCAPQARRR